MHVVIYFEVHSYLSSTDNTASVVILIHTSQFIKSLLPGDADLHVYFMYIL